MGYETYEELVKDVDWFMEHKNDADQCGWFKRLKSVYPEIPDRELVGYWYQLSENVFAGCLGIPSRGYRQYVISKMEELFKWSHFCVS